MDSATVNATFCFLISNRGYEMNCIQYVLSIDRNGRMLAECVCVVEN